MIKIVLFVLIIAKLSFSYEIIDNENIYTIKIQDKKFETIYAKLKDEINHRSFIIIKELNLAKATNNVAKSLKQKPLLEKGKNILICKSTFAHRMLEENISNITYCPLSISVYKQKDNIYISYRKYKALHEKSKIHKTINKRLKTLILNSVNN